MSSPALRALFAFSLVPTYDHRLQNRRLDRHSHLLRHRRNELLNRPALLRRLDNRPFPHRRLRASAASTELLDSLSLTWGPKMKEAGEILTEGGDDMVGCSSWLGHFGLAVEDPATYAAAGCALANFGREVSFAGDTLSHIEGCSSMQASTLAGVWDALRQGVNELYIAAASGLTGVSGFEHELEQAASKLEEAIAAGEAETSLETFAGCMGDCIGHLGNAAESLGSSGEEMASEPGVRENAGKSLVASAAKITAACEMLAAATTLRGLEGGA
mmetsp:Transcript_32084/g.78154  ORF Transcript_32084/g.78154 Transcript_32084/m.78154 type:complete len:273 (-) Transcript_32084:237-1055(-)